MHLQVTDIAVKNVLVGACEECGEAVSIPPQSTPRLREARKGKEHTVEARIPRHLEDVVFLVAGELGVPAAALRGAILRYYLCELRTKKTARRIERLSRSELARGRRDARVSLRVDEELWRDAWAAGRAAGLRTRSDLVRGALIAAKEDLLDGGPGDRRRELQRLAAAI